jgi:hypothetical protein
MQDAKKKVNEKIDKFKSAIQPDAPWPLSSLLLPLSVYLRPRPEVF